MFKLASIRLTVLLSIITLTPQSYAATMESVTILQQLEQVVKLFTGEFSNYPQFNNDNTVPLITMSNCSVDIIGGSFGSDGRLRCTDLLTGSVCTHQEPHFDTARRRSTGRTVKHSFTLFS